MYPGCNPDVDPHGGWLDALITLYPPYISPYLPISPAHSGAHAFVLLPRRTALERRLSDGLAFVDKCRLLAKVDGDGVEQRTYLHARRVETVRVRVRVNVRVRVRVRIRHAQLPRGRS